MGSTPFPLTSLVYLIDKLLTCDKKETINAPETLMVKHCLLSSRNRVRISASAPIMKNDKYKNTIWSAYGDNKQEWKKDNYYTGKELSELDKVDDFNIQTPKEEILDGN